MALPLSVSHRLHCVSQVLRFFTKHPSLELFSNRSWRLIHDTPFVVSIQNPKLNAGRDVEITAPQLVLSASQSGQYPNSSPISETDVSAVSSVLANPSMSPGVDLENELERTGIEPSLGLLDAVFNRLDSSPKPLFTLFKWAEKKLGFGLPGRVVNYMINALGKAREFEKAWSILLDRVDNGGHGVSGESFVILMRRYARAGMAQAAIRTYEYVQSLESIHDLDSKSSLLEILLDSLCKEGHVKLASEYLNRWRLEPTWVPSIRVYNILLHGWFRIRNLKKVETLWIEMKRDSVTPTVVTYGTLVEGYCRMRRVERAIELVTEMRREGIEPNAIVYNPVVDALGEAGRFKEAMGMIEHFSVAEPGPTISTYNSLIKGMCKAGNLVWGSKMLKTMVARGIFPTITTYNYFFKHFSKYGKIDEGMNLYTKLIESGYKPDRLTYHLLIKMLCEQDKLGLALQIRKEMRACGFDIDLATHTMLVHLLCKLHRLEEAFSEIEDMIHRGVVPQYLTFCRLNDLLKKDGMIGMSLNLRKLMASVPHSTALPNTYIDDEDSSRARRTSIMKKAQIVSNILKTSKDPRELVKHRRRKLHRGQTI